MRLLQETKTKPWRDKAHSLGMLGHCRGGDPSRESADRYRSSARLLFGAAACQTNRVLRRSKGVGLLAGSERLFLFLDLSGLSLEARSLSGKIGSPQPRDLVAATKPLVAGMSEAPATGPRWKEAASFELQASACGTGRKVFVG